MRWLLSLCLVGWILISATPLFSEEQPISGPVKIEIVSEETSVQPGNSFWIALDFRLEPKWHIYWKNPGDSGAPINLHLDLPPGFKVEKVKWPVPKRFDLEGLIGLGYEDNVTLLVKIHPSTDVDLSKEALIKANVQWVACHDECIPSSVVLEKSLKVSKLDPKKDDAVQALFTKARQMMPQAHDSLIATLNEKTLRLVFSSPVGLGELHEATFYPEKTGLTDLNIEQKLSIDGDGYALHVPLKLALDKPHVKGVLVGKYAGQDSPIALEVDAKVANHGDSISLSLFMFALLAAFGGGILLNLMPCVLPVLSLKVLSVVQAKGARSIDRLRQGVAYVVGILASFWVLTAILLIVRASGSELGWGFQLQEPIFVGMLTLLLFLMALNFFGVFEMGSSFIAFDGVKKKDSKVAGAFFSGVLATVVATPCTGPFLGASLGFAMTLPWVGTFGLFTVMALGMALPFFILTVYPKLLKFVPKPGNWMIALKQAFGFILVLTTLWLVWVFEAETSFMSVMNLLLALLVMSIGAWLYGRFGGYGIGKKLRNVMRAVALLAIVSSIALVSTNATPASNAMHTTSKDSSWEPFSKARLEELRTQGTAVFIDFTAKWCLLCQANKAVLHSNQVNDAFKKAGIVKLDADWTRGDPEITKILKEFGRTGVPLYVMYSKDKGTPPRVFSETLTQEMLVEASTNVH